MAGLHKVELYLLSGTVAIAVAVAAAFSTGPGGFTMTAEEAAIAAHEGPRLIVVETSSCGWCKRLRKEIAPDYLKSNYHTEVAPLIYASYGGSTVRKLNLSGPIRGVPTLLVVDREGNEMGRIGYPGSVTRLKAFVGRYAG